MIITSFTLIHIPPNVISHSYQWSECIFNFKGVQHNFLYFSISFSEQKLQRANNGEPDHMSNSFVPDLGLHCLPMSKQRTTGLEVIKLFSSSTKHEMVCS